MENLFPYEVAKLMVGPIRVVYADPSAVAIPEKIQDIQEMEDPYSLVTGWKDFGAMVNPPSYSTSNTQNNLGLQNQTGPVDTEVTEVARSMGFNIAHIAPEELAIIEQASDIETIAAASGASAQKSLEFGSFDDVDMYRIAFIGKRKKKSVLVTESTGLKRGGMVATVLYSAALAGDAKSISYDRGNYASCDVTFASYSDEDAPAGKDSGRWLFEDAGTIT